MKYLYDICQEYSEKLRDKSEALYDLKRAVNIHSDKDTEKYVEGIIVGLAIAIECVDELENLLANEHPDRWLNDG